MVRRGFRTGTELCQPDCREGGSVPPDIDTEMATLKQSLPPGQYAYFEAFLIKLFVQSKIPQGMVVTGVSR
jgi:hypothetical protein